MTDISCAAGSLILFWTKPCLVNNWVDPLAKKCEVIALKFLSLP